MKENGDAPQLGEATLDFLEQQIPALAAAAVTIAYNDALARGESVLQVEGDESWSSSFPTAPSAW